MYLAKDIISGALDMAQLGYHVFPLLERCKTDTNKRGTPIGWNHNNPDHKHSLPSTTDLDEIIGWAHDYKDIIGYGVNPRGRRAIVLDVDVKGNKVGAASLKALVKDFKLSLNTFCVKTKSGGLHLYYSYDGVPEEFYVKGTAIDGYKDIDIRADNNFLNGPFPNGNYTIIKNESLSSLPSKLIEELPLQPIAKGLQVVVNNKDAEALEYKDPLLKGLIPDVIPLGERDNTIIRLIGSWARKHPIETTLQLTKAAIIACEKDPKDKISINDYIPKIESTYEKLAFRPLTPDMLAWMEDHLILIPERRSVYMRNLPAHKALISKDAAIDRYKNWIYYLEPPEGSNSKKKSKVQCFPAWMESPRRQDCRSFGYYPSDERIVYCDVQDCDVVNTYSAPFQEFKYNEKTYDDHISKFLEFCDYLFEDHAQFMLDWVAHQVQKPNEKLSFAPVMYSEARGVGKNLFFDIVKNLVGKWNTTEAEVTEVVDKHCEFALRHHLVLINEASIDARDKRALNTRRNILETLKSKITENMQTVEPKYIGRFNVRSYVNYIVATNNLDAIPMEQQDRRFFVMDLRAKKMDKEFYELLWEMARSPLDEPEVLHRSYALRQYMMKRDVSKVNRGDVAVFTEAKQEMIDANKSSEQIDLDEAIMNHYSIFRSDVITKELFDWYVSNKMPRGSRLSSGAIRDLFKIYFKPIRINETSGRAKQVAVQLPDRMVDGMIMNAETKKCGMFTVRQHYGLDKSDVAFVRGVYGRALDATKHDYKEPVEDIGDVKNENKSK